MVAQHHSKAVRKMFKKLEELGFSITRNKGGVYKISPPSHIQGPTYSTHGTESSLHPMRRDFKKLYKVEV
jgi:hypothetical protein